jgi:hypothetical protein
LVLYLSFCVQISNGFDRQKGRWSGGILLLHLNQLHVGNLYHFASLADSALSVFLQVAMFSANVPPRVRSQVWTQVFFFIDCYVFNSLLERAALEKSTAARGVQVRYHRELTQKENTLARRTREK